MRGIVLAEYIREFRIARLSLIAYSSQQNDLHYININYIISLIEEN